MSTRWRNGAVAHPAGRTSRQQCLCSLKSNITCFLWKVQDREPGFAACYLPAVTTIYLWTSWLHSARVAPMCHSRSKGTCVRGTGAYPVPGKQTHPPLTESALTLKNVSWDCSTQLYKGKKIFNWNKKKETGSKIVSSTQQVRAGATKPDDLN